MSDLVDTFLAITGSSDTTAAKNFLEMSNNNLDMAISFFFEHGGNTNTTNSEPAPTTNWEDSNFETDEQMAERLQNEAYKSNNQEPRAPMEARHERLVGDDIGAGMFSDILSGGGGFSGMYGGNHQDQIFGSGRRGIFNQVDDEDEDRIVELDSDDSDNDNLNTTQQRLAKIFRPPFDLIEKIDLNTAKVKARKESKWLLVNIQDTSEFQCQMLNRDFWSNANVKQIVRDNFIFLQYHKDSRSGEQYSQFYPVTNFPHIAILDPITGERVKIWEKIPDISSWVNEVYEFLNKFSLDPKSINPLVKNKAKVDVNSLSEEKQLEYAIQQSLNKDKNTEDLSSDSDMDYSDADDDSLQIMNTGNENDPIDLDSEDEKPKKELTEFEKISQINAVSIDDEPTTGDLTRIQIRTSDGKRVIRKFKVGDKVEKLYQFVKNYLITNDALNDNQYFSLTSQRENLIEKLDTNIDEAGLKNASVLVEVINEGDD